MDNQPIELSAKSIKTNIRLSPEFIQAQNSYQQFMDTQQAMSMRYNLLKLDKSMGMPISDEDQAFMVAYESYMEIVAKTRKNSYANYTPDKTALGEESNTPAT